MAKELGEGRDDSFRVRDQSTVALKYFGNLVQDSAQQRAVVEGFDLEALKTQSRRRSLKTVFSSDCFQWQIVCRTTISYPIIA
jgi:hypothetical protein